MMTLTTFYVELDRHDETIAGTLGDTSWIGDTTCEIITDDPDGLTARLEDDENVLYFTIPTCWPEDD